MSINEIDVFHRPPGEVQQINCRACGARCAVTRGAHGPTCFAEALARHGRPHDRFTCPHAGAPWHARACALRQEIDRTPSRRLAAVMEQELSELCAANLRNRQSTRNNEGGAS